MVRYSELLLRLFIASPHVTSRPLDLPCAVTLVKVESRIPRARDVTQVNAVDAPLARLGTCRMQ